jgi:hypothetical protein
MPQNSHVPPPGLRPKKTRCKTGCLCCRLRGKRCDEQKPTCISCDRVGLLCAWPSSNEFAWRQRMGLSKETTPPTTFLVTTSNEVLRVQSAASGDWPPNEDLTMPRSRSSLLELTLNRVSVPPPLQDVAVRDPTSRQLLHFYVEFTCPQLLSMPPEFSEPFLAAVLPWAFSDPLILNALLAAGAFPKALGQEPKGVEAKSLQHYWRAIRELKVALTDWETGYDGDPLRLLLITLLLRQHEVREANRR